MSSDYRAVLITRPYSEFFRLWLEQSEQILSFGGLPYGRESQFHILFTLWLAKMFKLLVGLCFWKRAFWLNIIKKSVLALLIINISIKDKMGCYRCSSNSNGDFDLGMCCLISSCLQSASYFRSVFCSTFTLIASRFDHIVSTVAACRCVSNIRAQLVLHCAKSCDQKRTVLLCFSRNILQRMHW